MPFVVVLYFDPQTDALLDGIWHRLEEAGIPTGKNTGGYRPHVSLGVTATAAQSALARRLADFAAGAPPLELIMPSVGVFPTAEGVVFLGVVATEALLEVHAGVHRLLSQETMGGSAYYTPGNWLPHCTVAFRVPRERIGETVNLCMQACERGCMPVRAQVSALALVEVLGEGSREVAVYPWGRGG